MFDGKYNDLLDNAVFRFGLLTLGTLVWAAAAVALIAAR